MVSVSQPAHNLDDEQKMLPASAIKGVCKQNPSTHRNLYAKAMQVESNC